MPLDIHRGGRSDLTITGALASDTSRSVNVGNVWDRDTPYTAGNAWASLEKVACQEVLGSDSAFLEADGTNHARQLKEYAVTLYAASHEKGVSKESEYKEGCEALKEALKAYEKKGEGGYSATCNVGKPAGYECDKKLKSTIDKLVTSNPGVFHTAATLMHKQYLRDGLVRAQSERLGGLRFDSATMENISRNGNGDTHANAGLTSLLNGFVLEGNAAGLSGFMRTMLTQLDFGRAPKSVDQSDQSPPAAAGNLVGGAPQGGGQSSNVSGGITLTNINHPSADYGATLTTINQALKDLLKQNCQLQRELAAVRNLMPSVVPSSHQEDTPPSGNLRPSREVPVETQDALSLPPDVQDGQKSNSSPSIKGPDVHVRENPSPGLSETAGVPATTEGPSSPSAHECVTDFGDASKQSNERSEMPPKMPLAMAFYQSADSAEGKRSVDAEDMPKRPANSRGVPVPPPMPVVAAGYRTLETLSGSSSAPKSSSHGDEASAASANLPLEKPNAFQAWDNAPIHADIKLFPQRFPALGGLYQFMDAALFKRFCRSIAGGFSPIGGKAKALRNFIIEGKDPSKAKADGSAEEAYIAKVWQELEVQSPAVAVRVKSLFDQYTKALKPERRASTRLDRVVTSLGGSTWVSGNPSYKSREAN
ncbi:hypothetical protein PflCFBP13517_25650 [Pseudomonas fluorescens]|nr:hypothetical protein PflCFBP13517_25650 [Pseudomonas fluorescens]